MTPAGREASSLHYEDSGTGRVVVLIHGLGASSRFWTSTIDQIVSCRRVIAVDLPGFGRSPMLEGLVEITTYSDAIATVLRGLQLVGSDVVGHSLGGLIAQRLAIDHPDLVGNLMLVSPGDLAVSSVRKAAMSAAFRTTAWFARSCTVRRLIVTSNRVEKVLSSVPAINSMPPAVVADLIFNGLTSEGLSPAISAALRDRTFTESSRILSPTLLVQGERDRLVTVSSARALADRIPSARLQVWKGAGHCPMFDRPARFAAAITTLPESTRARHDTGSGSSAGPQPPVPRSW
jgi:pimeloyl-ACP methyl ester carboxylesterase